MLKLSHWQSRRLGRPPSEEGWLCWGPLALPAFPRGALSSPCPTPPPSAMSQGAEGQAILMPAFPNPLPCFLPVMQRGSG